MQTKQFKIRNIEINKMPDSNLYYYVLNENQTTYSSGSKKMFTDQYYPINLNSQYVHFLIDGIGGYFQLKKIYPNLKPIYFITQKDMGNPNKKANYDALKILNAEIIDITSNNCYFQQLIIPHSFLSPISFTDFFMYLDYDIDKSKLFHWLDGSKMWYCNSSKILFDLFSLKDKSLEKNIYISRSVVNKKIINDKVLNPRSHNPIYDEILDNEMKNLGYEIIFSEDYGLFEQIELFSKAKNFVSISGSSLLNGIWCHPKANITEIKVLKDYSFYWKDILYSTNKNLNSFSFFDEPSIYTIENIIKKIQETTI